MFLENNESIFFKLIEFFLFLLLVVERFFSFLFVKVEFGKI